MHEGQRKNEVFMAADAQGIETEIRECAERLLAQTEVAATNDSCGDEEFNGAAGTFGGFVGEW